jgi:hypothetical protein
MAMEVRQNTLRRQIFIEHPNTVFPVLALVLAIPALPATPSFVPLVVLVASLLVHSKIIAHRPNRARNLVVSWLAVSLGVSIGHLTSSLAAIPSTGTAIFSDFILSAISSFLALCLVNLELYSAHSSTPWARTAFFPAVWSTGWQVIARFSPIGHLMAWTPIRGTAAYDWMRPYFGPWGVNWVTAAFAVVCAEVAGSWFMGNLNNEEEHEADEDLLVDVATSTRAQPVEEKSAARVARGAGHVLFLAVAASVLAIPSSFLYPTPAPVFSDASTAIRAGCILPLPPSPSDTRSPFDRYLAETRQRIPDAPVEILLWPEAAVRFDNAADRDSKLALIANVNVSQHSYVGVSFEEPVLESDGRPGTKRRNGMALIGPDGVVLQYYKRNLVPCAYSFLKKLR